MQIKEKLFPKNSQDIAKIVKEAPGKGVGIVPCGKGSNISSYLGDGEKPVIIVSLEKMNAIEEFEKDNLSVRVQAGIRLGDLQKELEKHGVFLPMTIEDNGERTIGGLIAENLGGYEEYAYGKIQDYILGLQFVTPYGEIVKTGGKTVKNVSGYDFTKLFANSLGTLGIITSVTFKLKPLVEKRSAVILEVPTLKKAAEIVEKIIAEKLATVTLKLSGEKGQKIKLIIGLAGFKETVVSHLQIIKKYIKNMKFEILENDDLSKFWRDYFNKNFFVSDTDFLGRGDKRVLFDISAKCEQSNVLDALTYYEMDFGAGSILLKMHKQITEDFKKKLQESLLDFVAQDRIFSYNFESIEPSTVFFKLKEALDPEQIMFPNNKLLGGEYLG